MLNLFLTKDLKFPPVENATDDGVVAIGGDLSVDRLLLAYKTGIFPWFSEGDPILWWSPDPRFVLFPKNVKISDSMKKILKKNIFEISFDTSFSEVIKMCRKVRVNNEGTWITKEMIKSYSALHELGFAHSVETWHEGKLVGGLYGVSMGSCFFGESMFSTMDNASKFALIKLSQKLVDKNFSIIDCQVYTKHLSSMGAFNISRDEFLNLLNDGLKSPTIQGCWKDF
jgi:leucyl/phenylalanyl-tRNA--protein transferase